MPRFQFTAFDTSGRESTGFIEASSSADVLPRLKSRGLFPTVITSEPPAETSPATTATRFGFTRRPPSDRQVCAFTRQFAVLLKSGMPAVRALEILSRQETNPIFKGAIDAIARDVRAGATISAAMMSHPKIFDRLYLNLVRAGEASGALDVVLDRLARFSEKSLALRGRIRAALTYPAVVLAVAFLILGGLLVFVVPKFQQIFADLLKGAPLPPLTQAVLAVAHAVKSHAAFLGGALLALVLSLKAVANTVLGRRVMDAAVLRAPVMGPLVLQSNCARFARTLGTLLHGGVPILDALLITRDTTPNARVAAALDRVHDRVKTGDSVAKVIDSTRIFPPLVASMIEVGEHTGQLAEMLRRLADIYEDEVDRTTAALSSLLEPFLILFLAFVVGTIVIALFLPIVRMVQLLS